VSQSPLDIQAEGKDDYLGAWGALYQQVDRGASWSGRERHRCFLNLGRERFANVSSAVGIDYADDGRGLATVDWDHDGDLDFWISNRTGPTVRFLRNETPAAGQFVALRLVGRESNRDAIGARVEVHVADDSLARRIRTVRAGDGFRTQSSKWLHFGLDEAAAIQKITVRWPNGRNEEFTDVAIGGRYELVEGSGVAAPRSQGRRVELEPSELRTPQPTEQARVVLASRVPLPLLSYTAADGAEHSLNEPRKRPWLLNLWASWCKPCVEELNAFAKRAEELRSAGLDVVAINVEQADPSAQSVRSTALRLLKRIEFPFDSGFADRELYEKLEMVLHHVIARRRPMPAPSSFLVDPRGEIVVIYKGPVTVDQLLKDVAMAPLSGPDVRNLGVPFRGRWYYARNYPNLSSLAHVFEEHGFREDGLRYRRAEFEMYRSSGRPQEQSWAEAMARGVAIQYNERGAQAYEQNRLDEAVAMFREAVTVDAEFAEAYNNLATALIASRRWDEAEEALSVALKIKPDFVAAARNFEQLQALRNQRP